MKPSRIVALIDVIPRILIVFSIVAVICHLDNVLYTAENPEVAEVRPPMYIASDVNRQKEDLAQYIRTTYRISADKANEAVHGAFAAAADTGLPPTLILAVAAKESSFKAASDNGVDKGPMQVNPRKHPEKIRAIGGASKLFDMTMGMLVGARVLKEYTRNRDINRALLRYNGASFENGYDISVLEKKRVFDSVRTGEYFRNLQRRCRYEQRDCYT